MKRAIYILLALAVGVVGGAIIASYQWQSRHAVELAGQEAAWQREKAEWEASLENAVATAVASSTPTAVHPTVSVTPGRATPSELIARLRALKFGSGSGQSRVMRQAIHDLEELIAFGPAALTAIRTFLTSQEDIDFSAALPSRGARGGFPEFVFPPSLRLGLFEVVKQIGGTDGERILGETLGMTKRGVELAWLARALQEWAPNKYREAALTAARELLARTPLAPGGRPIDPNDRESLFAVLAMYGDTSYVNVAQMQLVQPDGALDRNALKYLQEALGAQSVSIAAEAYQNPLLLTNSAAKEPLVRLVLNFVGETAQANEFYQQAINDPALTKNHRKNLIEDLNQEGFSDRKNLSARDLALVQNRLALLEQLAPAATDPINLAAMKEAYKDLVNMRDRATRPPNPPP